MTTSNHLMRIMSTVCLAFSMGTVVQAQGTIRFGFEEYEVGVTPPFVRMTYKFEGVPVIGDKAGSYLPFEGQRMLLASGNIAIASPDGNLIKDFSLRFIASQQRPGIPVYFSIGNIAGDPSDLGEWFEYRGSFDSPVREIAVSAFYNEGQTFALGYAIDAIEFHTVPEPGITALIAVGLIGFAGSTWKGRRR